MSMVIGPYDDEPAQCHEYDPRSPEVAALVAAAIREAAPALRVEHVGSTAVPGCDGKGIIDVLVLYPTGGLEDARSALAAIGFQPQTSAQNPFPEDRPMRTGSVLYGGTRFRIHVHVVWTEAPEAAALVAFRDRLRADSGLRDEYVRQKRAIIAAGITQTGQYSNAKGGFIRRARGLDDH